MQAFLREATDTTPKINFDPQNGAFVMQGKSIPSDAEPFYSELLDWMDDYVARPNAVTNLEIRLDYFNISSSKRILFMFYKFDEIVSKGKEVSVKWFYHEGEDEMLEVGQDFAFMVNIPFEFVEYSHYEPVKA